MLLLVIIKHHINKISLKYYMGTLYGYIKLVSSIRDHKRFMLMKLTRNPPVVTIISCEILFLLVSFLLPFIIIGGISG